MKSLQQDHKIIRTSCKDCVFAQYENNTQVNCLHNRIKTFKQLLENNDDFQLVVEAYDNEKEFYVINRFCNLYRDKNTYQDKDINCEKAFDEIKLTFDVLIDCNDINDDNYFNYIKSIIASSVFYGSNKISFHFYHNQSLNKDGRKKALNLQRVSSNSYLSVYYQKDILQHGILSKTKNSYHMIITKDSRPDKKIFDILNNIVNIDLKKVLVCNNNNVFVVSNLSYKIETMGKIDVKFNETLNNIIEYAKPEYYIEV